MTQVRLMAGSGKRSKGSGYGARRSKGYAMGAFPLEHP